VFPYSWNWISTFSPDEVIQIIAVIDKCFVTRRISEFNFQPRLSDPGNCSTYVDKCFVTRCISGWGNWLPSITFNYSYLCLSTLSRT
jgi:hypothetical protein